MEDTVASTSPARRRETILNEVKVKKPAQFAIARLFSQARSQMKQEAFSLRFTSIYSLCGASHSKVLVPITEFQTKPVKRKKKKKTLPVISISEDTDGSVKTVCWDRVFTALELFLCMTFTLFSFPCGLRLHGVEKPSTRLLGGVCVDAGQQSATSSSWAFHYFKDTVWKSTLARGGRRGLPQTRALDFCVRPQVSGEAV